jgi:hypothetical protein
MQSKLKCAKLPISLIQMHMYDLHILLKAEIGSYHVQLHETMVAIFLS